MPPKRKPGPTERALQAAHQVALAASITDPPTPDYKADSIDVDYAAQTRSELDRALEADAAAYSASIAELRERQNAQQTVKRIRDKARMEGWQEGWEKVLSFQKESDAAKSDENNLFEEQESETIEKDFATVDAEQIDLERKDHSASGQPEEEDVLAAQLTDLQATYDTLQHIHTARARSSQSWADRLMQLDQSLDATALSTQMQRLWPDVDPEARAGMLACLYMRVAHERDGERLFALMDVEMYWLLVRGVCGRWLAGGVTWEPWACLWNARAEGDVYVDGVWGDPDGDEVMGGV